MVHISIHSSKITTQLFLMISLTLLSSCSEDKDLQLPGNNIVTKIPIEAQPKLVTAPQEVQNIIFCSQKWPSNTEQIECSNGSSLNISVLDQFPNLKDLDLKRSPFENIGEITSLENLTSINLRRTKVIDISKLASFKKLETLTLSGTKVVDISGLASLKNLKTLTLSSTKVVDVSGLAPLKNLASLNLGGTDQKRGVELYSRRISTATIFETALQRSQMSKKVTLDNNFLVQCN